MKTDAANIETSGSWENVHKRDAMLREHNEKAPLAWDALRRALNELSVETLAIPPDPPPPPEPPPMREVRSGLFGTYETKESKQRTAAWHAHAQKTPEDGGSRT